MIFWALVLVVCIKYLVLVLRADNQGEGGILALMELVLPKRGRWRWAVLPIGLFGAALLYGDGTITPAISVLSAVEGLEVATPVFLPYILPIALAVLFLLFLLQQAGTSRVGILFGPFMLVWFPVLAVLGVLQIVREPQVLAAVNPVHTIRFVAAHGVASAFIIGAVFLVVTGGEALYADIGHFGKAPIRAAWFTVVLPCLLLNYFGQGALILSRPSLVSNPFYYLAPKWDLYPMVVLSTAAAIIATAVVTLSLRSSSNLSGAYGLAVSMTMVITTILAFRVFRSLWKWHWTAAVAVAALFLAIDVTFLSANAVKVLEGGWYPLAAGILLYLCMSTWARGTAIVGGKIGSRIAPLAFVHNATHNTIVHRQVIFFTVSIEPHPHVRSENRVEFEKMRDGFFLVHAHYGFMDSPNVPAAMRIVNNQHLKTEEEDVRYFVGRESLVASRTHGMSIRRDILFLFLLRNSERIVNLFSLPDDRVIEIGGRIKL